MFCGKILLGGSGSCFILVCAAVAQPVERRPCKRLGVFRPVGIAGGRGFKSRRRLYFLYPPDTGGIIVTWSPSRILAPGFAGLPLIVTITGFSLVNGFAKCFSRFLCLRIISCSNCSIVISSWLKTYSSLFVPALSRIHNRYFTVTCIFRDQPLRLCILLMVLLYSGLQCISSQASCRDPISP